MPKSPDDLARGRRAAGILWRSVEATANRSRLLPISLLIVWVLVSGRSLLLADENIQLGSLTLRQARGLTSAQLSNTPPCDVEGVVTFGESNGGSGFIHDGTDGMYFEMENPPDYHPGDRIRIQGRCFNGLFAPILRATNLIKLGTNDFPTPLHLNFNQLLQGQGDARWVEIDAQVMAILPEKFDASLTLRHSGVEFQAFIPTGALDTNDIVVGADLRMKGVLGSLFDRNGRFLNIHLQIPTRECVVRIDKRHHALRNLPLTPISTILKYQPFPSSSEFVEESPLPIRIHGIVTYGPVEGSLFVQDSGGGIEVSSPRNPFFSWIDQSLPRYSFPGIHRGDEVEVVGFPIHEATVVSLLSASVRRLGVGQIPPSQSITSGSGNFWPSGILVDMEATFLDNFNQADFGIGVLKTKEGILLEARHSLGASRFNWWKPYRNRSLVHVSGVIQGHALGPGVVIEHTIWLDKPSDIVLIKSGPWPTATQARRAAQIGAGGIFVALIWGGILTFKLRRRRRELEAEYRSRLEIASELREQVDGQRATLEALTSAVMRMDRSGRVLSFNSATLSVLRLNPSELENLNWREALHAMFDAEGKLVSYDDFPLSRTFSTGESCIGKVFGVNRSNGTRQWLLISTAPVVRDTSGAVAVAIVAISDATDQQQGRLDLIRAREVAEAANQAKTDFLAVMSHEIRTPLNGVIGFTDLLLQVPLDEEARRFAGTIKESGEALLSVVNEVLDFTKIEAGHLELEHEVFPLIQTVEEVITSLSARADAKKLELVLDIHPEVAPEWLGDRGRLRQILTNLVGNAVKFTRKGTVELVLNPGQNGGLSFEVRDTGSGISGPELELLFQKFSQVRRSALPTEGGTGLGLAIVKQLVELMKGSVGCRSELDKGSTFWFTLPPLSPSELLLVARPLPLDMGGARLLLMSHSESVRRALARRLSSWGFQVDCVADGAQATALLQVADPSHPGYELLVWDGDTVGGDGRTPFVSEELPILPISPERPPLGVIEVRNGQKRSFMQPRSQSHVELWKPVVFPDALRQAVMTVWAAVRFSHNHFQRRPAVGRPKFLVVEDDRVNAMLAAYLLNRLSCDVQIASSGEEAISLCRAEPFDLILLNGASPGSDWTHTASSVRAMDGRYRQVPIVSMVHSDRTEDERWYRSSELNGLIVKPLRASELQALISRWIELVPVAVDS